MKRILFAIFVIALVSSCGVTSEVSNGPDIQTRGEVYAKMYEERPVVLLVMPPINNTTNVEAKDLLFTSILPPLAEAGYYVISPYLSMEIMKAESAYDAELFVDRPLDVFKKYFGCDAVVFSEINTWTKIGFGIEADIRYFIKSATTGDILFDRTCELYLDLSQNSHSNSGLVALIELAASAISTAATDHIVAARLANEYIFRDIPRGKYNPGYDKDADVQAEDENVRKTIKM